MPVGPVLVTNECMHGLPFNREQSQQLEVQFENCVHHKWNHY